MFARSFEELDSIDEAITKIKNLSDRIIGIGPINIIGLDGILALIPIPIIGTAYSVIAGLALIVLGMRAHVSLGTILSCTLILAIDSGLTSVDEIVQLVPVLGPFIGLITGGADAVFQGHLYAAHLIQKDMEKTLYVDDSARASRKEFRHKDYLQQVKDTKGKSRLVYLKP